MTNKTKTTSETVYNTEHVNFHNIKLTAEDFTEYDNYVNSLRYRNRGVLYNMVVQTNNNTEAHITVVDEWQVPMDEDDSSSVSDNESSDVNDDDSVS